MFLRPPPPIQTLKLSTYDLNKPSPFFIGNLSHILHYTNMMFIIHLVSNKTGLAPNSLL